MHRFSKQALFHLTMIPVALGLLSGCPALAQDEKVINLIVNGSFEEGPDPGTFVPVNEGSTEIKGWTVTRGQIDYIGTHWKAADGSRSLDLHGSPGLGGVKQTFKTKKGQKYLLTFYQAANPNIFGGQLSTKAILVQVANERRRFVFDCNGKTTDNMGWTTRTVEFTAQEDSTTLEICTGETTDPFGGPALDNVWVYEIKDPKK